MFVDSHCHLDRLKLDKYDTGLDGAIDAAGEAGVTEMLCVAIDLENIDKVIGAAERYENVFASVGVHPGTDVGEEPTVERLLTLADHPKVVAIGETGLDYYYGEERKAEQQGRFAIHLHASKACKKPVIVHTRDARDDTLAIIKKEGDINIGGVLHCFTENWDMAKRALDLNYFISFSGIVTFKNAEELRSVVKNVPLDRILIETDSPYLAPVPYRGKPNEPKYVSEVARCIAELKGVSIEHIAEATSQNYRALFKRTQ
ncbi:TatD family hydrolase [Alkalimarinus coralli]|uniref:TatD family hydrolase n=1 Tax=Alkalimarinus coralli TaxID=2935863 RepID=UPI00202B9CC8|nr:TatD family hydrolase [Alkalimarinus coralli]